MPSRFNVMYNAIIKCGTYLFCNSVYEHNKLQNINSNDVSLFSLNGKHFTAKIIEIYDGDTITVIFKLFGNYYKWKCRIMHVDTPEIKKMVKAVTEEEKNKNEKEKKRAIAIRDIMREKLINQIVLIHCFHYDKYGRLLIEFNLPETNIKIHNWLIENNYAKPYEGKHKNTDW